MSIASLVRRPARLAGAAVVAALALTACGGADAADTDTGTGTEGTATTVEVEDNNGVHTVTTPPRSVVVTDNRTFETLADWGVEPTAAAVALMPDTVTFANQDSVTALFLQVSGGYWAYSFGLNDG